MGTEFRIILYAESDSLAKSVSKKAFDRIDELNQIMSDYVPDSELNQLTQSAPSESYVPISQDLWNVIDIAHDFSKHSKGAFDITIGPLSRLWRRAFRTKEIPEASRIEMEKQSVSFKFIKRKKRTKSIKLIRPKMKLDLGGIAKGYAIDAAMEVLNENGIKMALVDGGGDLLLGDPPPNKAGWEIQSSGINSEGNLTYSFWFYANCAIATSGDTYRYLEKDGIRYSHIIDPRTGWGITTRRLVTVIAKTGTEADAMASTASVLSILETQKFLQKRKWKARFTSVQMIQPDGLGVFHTHEGKNND